MENVGDVLFWGFIDYAMRPVTQLYKHSPNVAETIFMSTPEVLAHKLVVGVLSTSLMKYDALPSLSKIIPMSILQNTERVLLAPIFLDSEWRSRR